MKKPASKPAAKQAAKSKPAAKSKQAASPQLQPYHFELLSPVYNEATVCIDFFYMSDTVTPCSEFSIRVCPVVITGVGMRNLPSKEESLHLLEMAHTLIDQSVDSCMTATANHAKTLISLESCRRDEISTAFRLAYLSRYPVLSMDDFIIQARPDKGNKFSWVLNKITENKETAPNPKTTPNPTTALGLGLIG
jgi:hypothetical protein